MSKIHYLKTWPEYFKAVKNGEKTFVIRKNDRPEGPYEVSDTLVLQEFDPETGYTGADDIWLDVTYVLDKQPFVPEGYVCMAVKEVKRTIKKLIRLDDLTGCCGYFATTRYRDGSVKNNGYGCTHRGNKDEPGKCSGFDCPVAVEASYNELLELDPDLAKEYEYKTKEYCFDPDAGLDNEWMVVWRPYYIKKIFKEDTP